MLELIPPTASVVERLTEGWVPPNDFFGTGPKKEDPF
jgi:hypothetical protein